MVSEPILGLLLDFPYRPHFRLTGTRTWDFLHRPHFRLTGTRTWDFPHHPHFRLTGARAWGGGCVENSAFGCGPPLAA